jgi:benzoate membrane transport protein
MATRHPELDPQERLELTSRRIERPPRPVPGVGRLWKDLGGLYVGNAFIGLLFAATGPVAVILSVGRQGGLTQEQLASWIFGVFFINGFLTVLASWLYRQPLSFFWTIPGTVLIGPAFGHLGWPEIVGTFFATGLLMVVLGLTGWVRRVMTAIPLPIVMAMVAAVFLNFGTGLVQAMSQDAAIAVPMVGVFVVLSSWATIGRWLPPLIGALVVGAVAVALSGRFSVGAGASRWVASPVFTTPRWSSQAMLELVVPLAITVLVVQNGQGVAVLRSAGHEAPTNAVAVVCGVWSLLTACVGGVSTCLTGPTNALLTASGQRSRHYVAGISCGLMAIAFGLLAPLFTRMMLSTPASFVAALGGLAMLRVLQSSFVTAFGGTFTLGALVTFIVTVSDVTVLSIGAAFWGLVAGFAVSWLLERGDFAEHTAA